MIRTVLTLATALAVLWHAAAGCCAHHMHTAAIRSVAVTKIAEIRPAAPANGGCRCRKHTCETKSVAVASQARTDGKTAFVSDDEHSAPHRRCDGRRCSLAATQPSSTVGVLLTQTAFVNVTTVLITVPAVTEATRRDAHRSLDDRAPPLRTHLALSVLLI